MWFTEVTGLEAVIPQLDVLYMTRIQRERFVDPLEYEALQGRLRPHPAEAGPGEEGTAGHAPPCPGWMKLPSTWTTIPGRSTSSRPATECTPAWPCSPIWPTRSGKNRSRWKSASSRCAPTPTASPRPSTTCLPGEAERRRGLLRLLRQGAAVKGGTTSAGHGDIAFCLDFFPILHILNAIHSDEGKEYPRGRCREGRMVQRPSGGAGKVVPELRA